MPILPYQIAVLCYLYDADGRMLLLHRVKPPNKDLYSPIGGKLHMDEGESPLDCALREMEEEVELSLAPADVRLAGLVTETAYNNETHWMMFLYEVVRPVQIQRMEFGEGKLEWHSMEDVLSLPIPDTDRLVILPLLQKHRGEFFHAHIDCTADPLTWRIEYPAAPTNESK